MAAAGGAPPRTVPVIHRHLGAWIGLTLAEGMVVGWPVGTVGVLRAISRTRAILSARGGAEVALANRGAERAAAPGERSGMPTPLLPRADGAIERGGRNHAEAL
jgi:hypothetical protein